MFSIVLGALLLIIGIVLAAARTVTRGKLSDLHRTGPTRRNNTLERFPIMLDHIRMS